MTPEEKAEALVLAFLRLRKDNKTKCGWDGIDKEIAIQCALIALVQAFDIKSADVDLLLSEYWDSVKQELKKMNQ